jgi:hypothetical protein
MDGYTVSGGQLEMIGHPSTFPPGLVESFAPHVIVSRIFHACNYGLAPFGF